MSTYMQKRAKRRKRKAIKRSIKKAVAVSNRQQANAERKRRDEIRKMMRGGVE